MFTYAAWHRDCSPEAPPQIVIRTQPAHGSVLLRPGQSTVSVIREGAPNCTGHTYPGIGVWYVPAPGFRGADQFDYNGSAQTACRTTPCPPMSANPAARAEFTNENAPGVRPHPASGDPA